MTNKKNTKHALLMSALALLLCMSMLIGTTFAWFTDEVTSMGNTIQSGTLDVDLVDANGNSMEGEVINFVTADNRAQDEILWEPGCTYETEPVYVVNNGNLALKYQIVINGIDGDAKLLEAIDWTVTVNGEETDLTDFEGFLIPGETVKSGAIVLSGHMKEEAGNEYQDLTVKGISITVLATQYTHENDSFDDQYDKDAPAFVDRPWFVNYTATEPYTVNGNGQTIVGKATSADVFTWIGYNGYSENISEMSNIFSSANGSKVTVNDVTFTGTMSAVTAGHYQGSEYNNFNTEFNNVKIVDAEVVSFTADVAPALVVYGTAVLNNCQITGTTRSELDTENSPVYDMAVVNYSTTTLNNTKVGSIFAWNQAKLIVAEGSEVDKIVVMGNANMRNNDQVVTVEAGATVGTIDLSAITDETRVKITIEDGATFGGFVDDDFEGVTFATLDAWKAAKNGSVVSNDADLKAALAAGGNVVLGADVTVDANTAITVASGKNVTLDLNGHTISATADKTGNQELFLVKGNMTVKNGNIELTAKNNQGWNAMATIFDVTAGGVLNMDGVTASVSGTDMNFIVHLNNWGDPTVADVTLNVNNCDFTTTYCAVRVFNGGPGMNDVTIENSNFVGGRMLWVHNYTSEGKDDSTLDLDIYSNDNTSDNANPVRFGFDNAVYYDLNGNVID